MRPDHRPINPPIARGPRGSDQLHFYDANQVAPENRLAYGHSGGGVGNPASFRAYPQFGADGTIVIWGHGGESRSRRLARGIRCPLDLVVVER